MKIKKILKKANKLIPGGNSFLSKNPKRFDTDKWPSYFSKSDGCKVWDVKNKMYFDFSLMGVGTNILGYRNKKVDLAVTKVIQKGNMTTLNCPEEVEFADLILKVHPWAQMAKFSRTGAEADAIALRLARAYNKKNKTIICGYHGWHDWYLSAKFLKSNHLETHLFPELKVEGVPKILKGNTYSVIYNDMNALNKIVKKDKDISAIIMEVERDKKPKKQYLKSVRKLCNDNKICLIFDECTSGFRETFGGIHLKYGVNPDIATFGKAIGNGYSLTAIIGKKKFMIKAKDTFISSTFWSERIGYAAAIATLKEMKRVKSWKKIKQKGKYIKNSLFKIAKKNDLSINFFGLDSLIRFEIDGLGKLNYKRIIIEEMLKKNFLATQLIYVSLAHSKKLIDLYIKSMDHVFKKISMKSKKK
jgi:glutamate-1-semialdehyde 2,1-aminomutase